MANSVDCEENAVRYTVGGTDQALVKVEVHSTVRNRYKDKSVNPPSPGGDTGHILFERASGSWWNPKFDSEALESEQIKSYFPQTRRRFQYALFYIIVACASWCLFFCLSKSDHWEHFLAGSTVILVIVGLTAGFSYTKYYEKYYLHTSIFIVVVLCVGILLQFIYHQSDLSTVGTFCASIEVMLMMYTVIPLTLFVVVGMGVVYSVLYEVFTVLHHPETQDVAFIIGKILLHLCIHLIGIHIFIMSQIRRRSTFWKIGQSAMARQDLEIEKQIKEQMIHSLMPASVAQEVMQSRDDKGDKEKTDDDMDNGHSKKRNSKSKQVKGEIIFRSFTMNQMEDVSILFADIVGFTKMSSNKTAEHLVGLLNDLFGRFDVLCAESGCEKISTLGDCYYCVSGCPESRQDHAQCCVEMGLGMITAIKEFDRDNKEQVDMRVGVHTGTVLCGIVGTRRFKFDVWSNDVTLANTMESTGQPGTVHISESSYEFLKDLYEVREGALCQDNRTHKVLIEHYDTETSKFAVRHKEDHKVMKTYFILGRKGATETETEIPSPDPTPNTAEDISIAMETAEPSSELLTESDSLVKDVQFKTEKEESDDETANHYEKRPGANGVSPAALLGRRHSSGFYATSELSLDNIGDGKEKENVDSCMRPINETWRKFRDIQESTDKQIIRCLKEGITDKTYFYKPPINRCTLRFNSDELEENYRNHYLQDTSKNTANTISSPMYHALLEIIVSFIVFTVLSTCCFMIFDRGLPWIILFIVSLILEILVLIHAVTDIRCPERKMNACSTFSSLISGWVFRNLLGAVLASIPIAAIYSNASCDVFNDIFFRDRFFCYCIVVGLLHFGNFTMLSSWMKSVIAALGGIVLLILLSIDICPSINMPSNGIDSVSIANTTSANFSGYNVTQSDLLFSGEHRVRYEIILDMVLLLLLILFFNREFEISYRLSYHGDYQAAQDKQTMQQNKEQADWLLHNIIPQHVSDVVKKTSKYSKNHKDVGVIFASIVNFNEFYDESYKGGREYLRVLNELVSDYECLLDELRFNDVEKIKTISSTFMAASGLNEVSRMANKHPYAHLFALMDFAIELQNVIARFNESIFNFEFILNIGYNFGEVTAGVIGTTKLLYDIWGDTVNISSRMYSTGIEGRIQVPQSAAELLKDYFEFEYRGVIPVKGKGDMHTYLLVKKKPVPSWE